MPLLYYAVAITPEQTAAADALVQHSIDHHRVGNIWDGHAAGRTRELRRTGTLGEIVFADAYGLPRPRRSFGAADGQDHGQDFVLRIAGAERVVDVKSMHRRRASVHPHYVVNLPAEQVHRAGSRTELYAHVSVSPMAQMALLVGIVPAADIRSGAVGTRFAPGTTRTRADATGFDFHGSTYEVQMRHLTALPSPCGVPFTSRTLMTTSPSRRRRLRPRAAPVGWS